MPFDPLTLADAADRVEAMIGAARPHFIVTPNVDFLVQARRDPLLHQILVQADLVLCDGRPLVWASQWLGNTLPGRVAGSDLVPILVRRAAERGWKIFILGGAEGVAAEAARRLAQANPLLPSVAHYSPPLRSLAQMDSPAIIARIRAAKPDIVLVCFGCPKQEKWIFQHYRAAGSPVMIGAGGTVDFLAGRLRRAPSWMRRTGTESLFRLWQEPRRLFQRYAGDLMHFAPAIASQLWRLRSRRTKPGSAAADPTSIATAFGTSVQASGSMQRSGLERAPSFWTQVLAENGHCLVDLAGVESIDSTGLAFLAHWQRHLAQAQRNLILYRPSASVLAALGQMRLIDQFIITDAEGRLSKLDATSKVDL